jgi:hypothetical protein
LLGSRGISKYIYLAAILLAAGYSKGAEFDAETGAEFTVSAPLTAPDSKVQFCQMHKTYGYVRAQFFNPENKLSFENPGGWFDAGLCWWHSRLQRAALYLTNYRPSLPKPNAQRALQIIDNVFRLKTVEVIPGFSNFQQFSHAFEKMITQYLSYIQVEDTAYFTFWRGVRPGRVSAAFIQNQAERIYRRVAIDDKVQYVALKGLSHWYESHAWLMVGAVRSESKIDFYYLDSNDSPQITPNKFTFTLGESTLNNLVPYLQYDSDFWSIDMAVSRYCR